MLKRFQDSGVFNFWLILRQVSGTIPVMKKGSRVRVDDTAVDWLVGGAGLVRSHSQHSFTLEGSGEVVEYSVKQTVSWEECGPGERAAASRLNQALNTDTLSILHLL